MTNKKGSPQYNKHNQHNKNMAASPFFSDSFQALESSHAAHFGNRTNV